MKIKFYTLLFLTHLLSFKGKQKLINLFKKSCVTQSLRPDVSADNIFQNRNRIV